MKRGGTAFTHTIPPTKTWIHMEKPRMTAAAVPAGIVPPRAIRNIALALTLTLVEATSIANPSLAQEHASSPATTEVMVFVTVKGDVGHRTDRRKGRHPAFRDAVMSWSEREDPVELGILSPA
jgi:hypothetical protein